METACRLGGFVAAQALWSVSEGAPAVPRVAFETDDGGRTMNTFEDVNPQSATAQAVEAQSANPHDAPVSVLAHAARLPLPGGECDTLVLYLTDHVSRRRLVLGVPYSPAPDFALRTLQVLHTDNIAEADLQALTDAFFTGLEEHPFGQRLWETHFTDA